MKNVANHESDAVRKEYEAPTINFIDIKPERGFAISLGDNEGEGICNDFDDDNCDDC